MNFLHKKTFICLNILSFCMAKATIEWSGTSCPDVLNEDLIINGDCQLPLAAVYILADNADITVTIPNDTIIASVDFFEGLGTVPTNIQLGATYPYSITIIVKKKLTFKGVAGLKDWPLQVVVSGSGSVRWIIEEDGKLIFDADENGGSAELWTQIINEVPSHSMVVHRHNQVHFGKRSKWGYMIDYCSDVQAGTVIEHHHDTFMLFEDLSSFALEAF